MFIKSLDQEKENLLEIFQIHKQKIAKQITSATQTARMHLKLFWSKYVQQSLIEWSFSEVIQQFKT